MRCQKVAIIETLSQILETAVSRRSFLWGEFVDQIVFVGDAFVERDFCGDGLVSGNALPAFRVRRLMLIGRLAALSREERTLLVVVTHRGGWRAVRAARRSSVCCGDFQG